MEFAIAIIIMIFILAYRGALSPKEIYTNNKAVFDMIKEKDYDFLVKARFEGQVDPVDYFEKRIKQAGIAVVVVVSILLFNFSIINLIIGLLAIIYFYKSQYLSLKSFYKKNLTIIDQTLPYYLKSLVILSQHYTIPVAISKSIETAPEMFKEGLQQLIKRIDEGDSSIDPYIEFANTYPVRDSLSMMRLLYRLSIGAQENKQQQLEVFSKTVSSLQNKAREKKYKARLDKMEQKTLIMMMVTGGGTMIVIFIAMLNMIGNFTAV